jgi:TM2 domain-containing membrane protein YozV
LANYNITIAPSRRLQRVADRSRTTALVLTVLLGWLGMHKFYLGRKTAGWVYLFMFWTGIPFALSIIDAIILFSMSDRDFDLRHNHSLF